MVAACTVKAERSAAGVAFSPNGQLAVMLNSKELALYEATGNPSVPPKLRCITHLPSLLSSRHPWSQASFRHLAWLSNNVLIVVQAVTNRLISDLGASSTGDVLFELSLSDSTAVAEPAPSITPSGLTLTACTMVPEGQSVLQVHPVYRHGWLAVHLSNGPVLKYTPCMCLSFYHL